MRGGEIFVEEGCTVERGAELYAPCHISGGSHICAGARVMPYCMICGAYVGEDTVVFSSTLISVHVGGGCRIGPYAYLREGAEIGENCRIGDFVEIKASKIGAGSKAAHLAYVGDAELGENVNVGCGAVFANYDGKTKRKSAVGNNCFIGCNCNIVAPVHIGDGAYIAAGTTVCGDVESGALCIGRVRERSVVGGAAGRYGE